MPKYVSRSDFQLVLHIRIAGFLVLDAQFSPEVSPVPLCSTRSGVPNLIRFDCD